MSVVGVCIGALGAEVIRSKREQVVAAYLSLVPPLPAYSLRSGRGQRSGQEKAAG